MKKKILAVFLSLSILLPASTAMAGPKEVLGDMLKLAGAGIIMQKLAPVFGLGKQKTEKEKKAEKAAKDADKMEKEVEKAAKKAEKKAVKEAKKENALALQKLAESGNVQAQCILAYAYHTGQRVEEDPALAKKWKDAANEQNEAIVRNFIPARYGKKKVGLSRLFAIAGHRSHLGEFVKCDVKEAVMWNTMGAAEKDTMALAYMGSAYYTGRGVKQDYAAAIPLLEEAGKKEPLALQLLADAFEKGRGVKKDLEKAKLYRDYLREVCKPQVEKKKAKETGAGDLNGIIR